MHSLWSAGLCSCIVVGRLGIGRKNGVGVVFPYPDLKERIMQIQKVNIAGKLSQFDENWSPRIVGEVNDCHVKVAKLKGEFFWHHHENEDEMFMVVKGSLVLKLRDQEMEVNEGEFVIIPRGVEHLPVAEEEVHVLLFEPKTTLNTGNVVNERTIEELEEI